MALIHLFLDSHPTQPFKDAESVRPFGRLQRDGGGGPREQERPSWAEKRLGVELGMRLGMEHLALAAILRPPVQETHL